MNQNGTTCSRKNAVKDVSWIFYHENGQTWSKGELKNDKRKSSLKYYSKNGTVFEEFTGTFKNNVTVSD